MGLGGYCHVGEVLCTLAKTWQMRLTLAHVIIPMRGKIGVLMLMLMVLSTLVRLSVVLPRRSSAYWKEESSCWVLCPLSGGIKVKTKTDLSQASANDFVGLVLNFPWAISPLLMLLRLLGQWTFL